MSRQAGESHDRIDRVATVGGLPSHEMLASLHEVTLDLAARGTVDELCHAAVRLGCSRLGFERMSVWFLEPDGRAIRGTYGVDETGEIRDEHWASHRFDPGSSTDLALRERHRYVRLVDVDLQDDGRRTVGTGMRGVTALWSSTEAFGCIYMDNHLRHEPISDAHYEILALYGSTLGHLIARVRAEEDLRRQRARVESILAAVPTGIGVVVGDVLVEVNAALCSMTGYARGELVGVGPTILIPTPEEQTAAVCAVSGQAPGGHARDIECTWLRQEGTSLDVLLNTAPVDPCDPSAGITFSALDVTARKAAQRALAASERRYRTMFELSPEAIVILDGEGRILDGNARVSDWTGVPMERFIGLRPHEISMIPEGLRDEVKRRLGRRLAGESALPYRLQVETRSGEPRIWNVMGSVVPGSEGDPEMVIMMFSDVTEQTALEARAQHSQKLESLGILAGGIAHDFNNLLTAVLGNADLLRMALPDGDPVQRHVRQIELGARRAAELASLMLAYSGRGRFVAEPLRIGALVSEMAELLEAAVPKKIVLRLGLDEGSSAVLGDATQLRQVIMNLITNGADAIGDGAGVLTVRTYRTDLSRADLARTYVDDELPAGPYVVLEVRDTGVGMDEATRRRVFEPFFTTKFAGRGLGLAAVLGIVRGHDGAISVESAVGRGATFRVVLPAVGQAVRPVASPAEVAPAPPAGPARPMLGSGTVLVADDEPLVREVARLSLESAGFDVVEAADGQEAVKIAEQRPDIVAAVLDLTMPKLGGHEALARLRTLRPDLPCVIMSGFQEDEALSMLEPHLSQGVGFVGKPFGPQALLDELSRTMA